MKNMLLAAGLVAGLGCLLSAEDMDVRITKSEGDVRVKIEAFENPIQVSKELILLDAGDVVMTGKNSRAELLVDGSSLIEIGQNTIALVGRSSDNESDIYLTEGEINAECESIARPGGLFQIKTPTAMVGIRGTEFALSAQKGGTELAVYSGEVEINQFVDSTKLSDKPVLVGEGMQTQVFYRAPPERPFAIRGEMLKRKISVEQLKRRLPAFRKNYKKFLLSERARQRNLLFRKAIKRRMK